MEKPLSEIEIAAQSSDLRICNSSRFPKTRNQSKQDVCSSPKIEFRVKLGSLLTCSLFCICRWRPITWIYCNIFVIVIVIIIIMIIIIITSLPMFIEPNLGQMLIKWLPWEVHDHFGFFAEIYSLEHAEWKSRCPTTVMAKPFLI